MPFWTEKALSDMTTGEWESLCDGCARCCLEKLQDINTDEISYTEVACAMLNLDTCRCSNYPQRQRYMPDCVELTKHNVAELQWMPSTCAYRLLAEGKHLPAWHPLMTGDPQSAMTAGISVKGRAVAEHDAGDLEDHIVDWPR